MPAAPPTSPESLPELSLSTVMTTIGRPHLSKALQSVLDQDLEGVEHDIVVVNDSGDPLADDLVPSDPRIQIVRTGSGRNGCGTSRNVGAVLAKGRYLHFFDDDDLMLPGTFQAFRGALSEHPDAQWIHGHYEQVDRDGTPLDAPSSPAEGNVLAPLLAGVWFPPQASLFRKDLFFSAGAFDPRYPTSEDMHLMMRMALQADMQRFPETIFRYSHGPEGSASPRSRDVEYLFQAHEDVFDDPRAGARLRASADTAFLQARIVRNYLISLKKNGRQQAYGKAVGRLLQALRFGLSIGIDGLRPTFWKSVFSSSGHPNDAPKPPSSGVPSPATMPSH